MGININVSVDELNRFADYISKFDDYIDADCTELSNALSNLASTMDPDTIATIASCVNQISRILIEQKPALEQLEKNVRNYADFVTRLKALAKN